MSQELRDLTVYILRASPFHLGHAETLRRALDRSRNVLVLIGSSFQPPTTKNPWSCADRRAMIQEWFKTYTVEGGAPTGRDEKPNLFFDYLMDHPYSDERWLTEVQAAIASVSAKPLAKIPTGAPVYLTGADRDASTYYLKLFPNVTLDLVEEDVAVSKFLSATNVRDIYFSRKLHDSHPLTDHEVESLLRVFVPETTLKFMVAFQSTAEYKVLQEEYAQEKYYKKLWSVAPHEPIFQTVDSVVIQTGHVLLINRRNSPGKGLWALPGGFLNPSEWMLDGAVRELYEETKIDVPEKVIYGSLKDEHTFEAPGRSLRGRTITRAFLFKLPDFVPVMGNKVVLPKVVGSDDARQAKWFPLSEVEHMSEILFEDHYSIIEMMVARLKDKR